ncbi:hypothetical protein [Nostoc sp.]|uniref:hypothetical protein n=1 Tax=Nostoc sp. TaxID=1180 RepID=UPI002FF9A650
MITLFSLIIFTLILFAFGLGVVIGKVFFQPKLEEGILDSYNDFQRDFVDFSERN